ncbi:glycoside hydrolase family 5 protein [Duganella vulcania]|nr:glycoside hydrolase family 5 protein [Duganella vulcania]
MRTNTILSTFFLALTAAGCGGGASDNTGAGDKQAGLMQLSGRQAATYPSYNTDPQPADLSGMSSDAVTLATRIKAGYNIGNTLEAIGGETNWGNPAISLQQIQLIKQSGFTAVRLPTSWDQYANQSTAKISDAWLARVKQVVQYCVDNGLYVIVNIHWDGGWLDNNINASAQASVNAKQKAYWEQIATALRGFDEHLIFASANEPPAGDATQMAILLSYHQTFINAVRSTGGRNAYRTLVVQGPKTDIDTTYNLMNTMPSDSVQRRMMAEVHYYTPYQFTLMDADQSWGNQFFYWGGAYHSTTDTAHNATWGEEADLNTYYGKMKTKFVNHGIPVVIGEFGAMRRSGLTGSNLQLHLNSRAYFLNYASRQAVANGMMPFYWDNGVTGNNGWAIFNRWNNTVVDQQSLSALIRGGNGLGL